MPAQQAICGGQQAHGCAAVDVELACCHPLPPHTPATLPPAPQQAGDATSWRLQPITTWCACHSQRTALERASSPAAWAATWLHTSPHVQHALPTPLLLHSCRLPRRQPICAPLASQTLWQPLSSTCGQLTAGDPPMAGPMPRCHKQANHDSRWSKKARSTSHHDARCTLVGGQLSAVGHL
jgi:hypothetical protein